MKIFRIANTAHEKSPNDLDMMRNLEMKIRRMRQPVSAECSFEKLFCFAEVYFIDIIVIIAIIIYSVT